MLFLIPSWLAWPCTSAVEAWAACRAAGGSSDHHPTMLAPDPATAMLETQPTAPHSPMRWPSPSAWYLWLEKTQSACIYKQPGLPLLWVFTPAILSARRADVSRCWLTQLNPQDSAQNIALEYLPGSPPHPGAPCRTFLYINRCPGLSQKSASLLLD